MWKPFVLGNARRTARWRRGETGTVTKPVAIGSDEAGYRLKGILIDVLREEGLEVADFGCHSEDPVDYPDVAFALAESVARGEHDRGILICGTGIGMSIAANKVPGIRAAQAHDPYSAERARKSNNAQILALGARVIGPELAKSIVRTWLQAEFEGGGSARKVGKIDAADNAVRRAGHPTQP
jgi:ribose 5-phosphate isomerase B